MDKPVDQEYGDDELDGPPMRTEADIRASLERSLEDIAAGRTVPAEEVFERARQAVERIRADRHRKSKAG